MNINRSGVEWIFVFLVASAFALLLAAGASTALIGAFGAGLLILLAFAASETVLPIILLLTLALGSAYSWELAQNSFYIRFLFLGLIALRGVLLFIQVRETSSSGRRLIPPIHWGFLITGLWGLVFSIQSIDPKISSLRAISFLLLYFVIFLYFGLRLTDESKCEGYAIAFWRTFGIIMLIGYGFLFARVPGMFMGSRLRLVIGNPNLLGHYCAMMSPLAIWYVFEKNKGKKLGWIVLGALFLSLAWSGSRGASVAALVGLLIQFGLAYRKKLVLVILALALLISVHLLMGEPGTNPREMGRVSEGFLREQTLQSGSGRREIWQEGWKLVQRRPWFGYGFSSVDRMFALGYFPNIPDFYGGNAHNSYLELLLSIGWIGSLPIFITLLFLLLRGTSLLRSRDPTPHFRFACALYAVMVIGVISSVVESWLPSVGSVFCFPYWFMAAMFWKMTDQFADWKKSPA